MVSGSISEVVVFRTCFGQLSENSTMSLNTCMATKQKIFANFKFSETLKGISDTL